MYCNNIFPVFFPVSLLLLETLFYQQDENDPADPFPTSAFVDTVDSFPTSAFVDTIRLEGILNQEDLELNRCDPWEQEQHYCFGSINKIKYDNIRTSAYCYGKQHLMVDTVIPTNRIQTR